METTKNYGEMTVVQVKCTMKMTNVIFFYNFINNMNTYEKELEREFK